MAAWLENFKREFTLNFIEGNRWLQLADGLKVTMIITLFAVIIGICIGIVIAVIRSTYDKNIEEMKGLKKLILSFLNAVAKVYLTVIRGTPVVVQLMIMYYIISKIPVVVFYF